MDTLIIIGSAGLTALVWKFVDFMRLLGSYKTEQSAIATQVLAWVGGIAAVMFYAASDFGGTVTIGDQTLDQYSLITQALFGLMAASVASAAVDVKQAIDSKDNNRYPPLL